MPASPLPNLRAALDLATLNASRAHRAYVDTSGPGEAERYRVLQDAARALERAQALLQRLEWEQEGAR